MSSSIGEAKKFIADAAQESQEALKAVEAARGAIDEALGLVRRAADDSSHDRVVTALKGFDKALEALGDARTLIADAQSAADSYAGSLG